mmetsp:Transcript_33978/g.95638  ORF Transcript_33978/g.95638 Transcript_33978/m.95638 type:complete len:220 (+) Transcript_33978:1008-1667(+)
MPQELVPSETPAIANLVLPITIATNTMRKTTAKHLSPRSPSHSPLSKHAQSWSPPNPGSIETTGNQRGKAKTYLLRTIEVTYRDTALPQLDFALAKGRFERQGDAGDDAGGPVREAPLLDDLLVRLDIQKLARDVTREQAELAARGGIDVGLAVRKLLGPVPVHKCHEDDFHRGVQGNRLLDVPAVLATCLPPRGCSVRFRSLPRRRLHFGRPRAPFVL